MKKIEAEKILKEKKEREAAEIQAVKTLEEAKIKEENEKIEAEKKKKREEYEAEKKRYPEFAAEIYQKCWECGKNVNLSSGEFISKFSMGKIIIVATCGKCGSYNIATVPTNVQSRSDHDQFMTKIDFS